MQSHYPEGSYKLRFYEGKRVIYRDVGRNAAVAGSKLQIEQTRQAAKADAIAAGIEVMQDAEKVKRKQLRQEVPAFIQRTRDRQRMAAADAYSVALREFLLSTSKTFVDELQEGDVLAFHRYLRNNGNSERTIRGKHIALLTFLRWCKFDTKSLGVEAPRKPKSDPVVYTPEELAAFFGTLDSLEHRAIFSVLLKCGLRMQEAMFLEWPDLDYRHKLLRIRAKPRWNFQLKDLEERSVPLPDDLAALLKKLHEKRPDTELVLGTRAGLPNWKLLQLLKRLAKRAGLNCSRCQSCRTNDECSHWTLHRFRASYATTLLRNGMDARTVMKMLGHSNLETVLRYLSPGEDKTAQSLVQGVNWY